MSSISFTDRVNGFDPLSILNAAEGVQSGRRVSSDADVVPVAPTTASTSNAVGVPPLTNPVCNLDLSGFVALPSMGANVLALIQETADEQRRANNEARFAEAQNIVGQLHEQADTIRQQAVSNLLMGMVAAGVQLTAAGFQIGSAAATLKSGSLGANATEADKMLSAAKMNIQNAKNQGITQAINAAGSTVTTAKEFTSAFLDAEMKDREAQIEMARAYLSQLDSLKDSLKEVIQKAMQAQNDIQAGVNQTRTKILT